MVPLELQESNFFEENEIFFLMSETNLQDLYQSILIQHSKSPSHYGKFEGFTHFSEGYNALCGDAITIYLSVKEGTIEKASFESASCTICKASASIHWSNTWHACSSVSSD